MGKRKRSKVSQKSNTLAVFNLSQERISSWRIWTLLVAAVLPFISALGNQYAYDDVLVIEKNPWIHSLAYCGRILISDYWAPVRRSGLYRPLASLIFELEWAVSPHDPAFYHLINLAAECMVVWLLFQVMRRLGIVSWAAWMGAMWFALLPLHAGVVAGLVGLCDILALLFSLAVMNLIAGMDGAMQTRSGRSSVKRRIYIFIFAFLGFLSKESAIVLPGIVALELWCIAKLREDLNDKSQWQWIFRPFYIREFWLVVIAAFIYLGVRVKVVGLMASHISWEANPLAHVAAMARVRTALVVAMQSLGALFWPFHLAPDYSYPQIPVREHWLAWPVLCAAGVFGVWTILCVFGLIKILSPHHRSALTAEPRGSTSARQIRRNCAQECPQAEEDGSARAQVRLSASAFMNDKSIPAPISIRKDLGFGRKFAKSSSLKINAAAPRKSWFLAWLGLNFCWLGYLPVSNLLFAIGTIRAGRLMYLPSAGMAVALAAILEYGSMRGLEPSRSGWNHWRYFVSQKKYLYATGVLVALIFAGYDFREARFWKNNESLFRMAVRRAPHAVLARYGLGVVEFENHEFNRARGQFLAANRLNSGFMPAGYEIARTYQMQSHFRQAHAWAMRMYRRAPTPANFDLVADLDLVRRRFQWIQRHAFDRTLRGDSKAQLALGLSFLWPGHPRRALPFILRAKRLSPDDSRIQSVYARIMAMRQAVLAGTTGK